MKRNSVWSTQPPPTEPPNPEDPGSDSGFTLRVFVHSLSVHVNPMSLRLIGEEDLKCLPSLGEKPFFTKQAHVYGRALILDPQN